MKASVVISATAFGLTTILTVFLNGIVLLTFCVDKRHKYSKKCIHIFITNLAICQLLIGLLVMPFVEISVLYTGWKNNRHLCQFNGFSTSVCFYTSVLMLCVISFDRFVAIVMATRYQKLLTRKRGLAIVLFIWSFSSVLSMPPLIGWSSYQYHPGTLHCSPVWIGQCGYFYFTFIISVIIPTSFTVISYSVIFMKVRKHRKRVSLWKRAERTVNVAEGQESVYEMSQVVTEYQETRPTPTAGLSPATSRKSLSPNFAIKQELRKNHLSIETTALNYSNKVFVAGKPGYAASDMTSEVKEQISRPSQEYKDNSLVKSKHPGVTDHQTGVISSGVSNGIGHETQLYNNNITTVKEVEEQSSSTTPTGEIVKENKYSNKVLTELVPDREIALASEEADVKKNSQLYLRKGAEYLSNSKENRRKSQSDMEHLRIVTVEIPGRDKKSLPTADDKVSKDAVVKQTRRQRPGKSIIAIFNKNRTARQRFEHVKLSAEKEVDSVNSMEASTSDVRDETSVDDTWKSTRSSSNSTRRSDTAATSSLVNVTIQPASHVQGNNKDEAVNPMSIEQAPVTKTTEKQEGQTEGKQPDLVNTLKRKTKKKQSKKMHQASRTLREFRVAKTGAILLTFFMICFGPYTIVHLCHLPFPVPLWAQHIAMWCVFFNSILSPLIYGFMNKETRTKVKEILRGCLSRSRRILSY